MDSEKITFEILRLDEIPSTSTYLKQLIADGHPMLREGLTVAAVAQTAGRGQRGNSWEAEPGRNVSLSVLLSPVNVPPLEQFVISEAVALAVADTVEAYLPAAADVRVKWPNDIYIDDKKISGTLIENTLCGPQILWSVCGIGLNVNQREFVSGAPNPVSLLQLRGSECPLVEVELTLLRRIGHYVDNYLARYPQGRDELHTLYMQRLWRGTGVHLWLDKATNQTFEASIAEVALTGHLTLRQTYGTTRSYAFKEVAPVMAGFHLPN